MQSGLCDWIKKSNLQFYCEKRIYLSPTTIFSADLQLKKLKILDFFKKNLTIFRKVKPKRTVQLLSRL